MSDFNKYSRESRLCKKCKQKTVHRRDDLGDMFFIRCTVCNKEQTRKKPPVRVAKKSDQYEDGVPLLEDEPRAVLKEWKSCDPGYKAPACKIHGALLRYEHWIWRCIVCGWAVKWVRKNVENKI